MRSKEDASEIVWEFIPDPDYCEKLRQAFAIILGGTIHRVDIQPFDETDILKQDEGAGNAYQ
jgi:hypothetical protein